MVALLGGTPVLGRDVCCFETPLVAWVLELNGLLPECPLVDVGCLNGFEMFATPFDLCVDAADVGPVVALLAAPSSDFAGKAGAFASVVAGAFAFVVLAVFVFVVLGAFAFVVLGPFALVIGEASVLFAPAVLIAELSGFAADEGETFAPVVVGAFTFSEFEVFAFDALATFALDVVAAFMPVV